MLRNRDAEELQLVGEECSNFPQMRVVGTVLQEFSDRQLRDCWASKCLIGFELENSIPETARRNPAYSQSGRQRL